MTAVLALIASTTAATPSRHLLVHPGTSLQTSADAAAASGITTLRLGAGKHRLANPLQLSARHSGLQFVGEDGATISGGVQVSGWEVDGGLWRADVSSLLAGHNVTRQLWVGGGRVGR